MRCQPGVQLFAHVRCSRNVNAGDNYFSMRAQIPILMNVSRPSGFAFREIDVEELPLISTRRSKVMSWVDSFVVDKKCTDQCLADAAEFIKFMSTRQRHVYVELPLAHSARWQRCRHVIPV
jgi:hypothetical protein